MTAPISLPAYKAALSIGSPEAARDIQRTVDEWRSEAAKPKPRNLLTQVHTLLAGLDGNGGCR